MACFALDTVLQKRILSITPCKFPTSLEIVKCHCLFPLLSFSPPKHTHFFLVRARVGNISTELSATDQGSPAKPVNLGTRKEIGSGIACSRQSVRNIDFAVVEEGTDELRFGNDGNRRKDMGFTKRDAMDSKNASVKNGYRVVESEDNSQIFYGKLEKKARVDEKVKVEKIEKKSKKNRADSKDIQLRARLDMCSKSGDVMGAIQLYDLALSEGVKMGQYHYTVLLYLCSSAAVGVIQPAKSGSGSRTLTAVDVSNKVSDVHFAELSRKGDTDGSKLNIELSNNGKQITDSGGNPGSIDKMELTSSHRFDHLVNTYRDQQNSAQLPNWSCKQSPPHPDGLSFSSESNNSINQEENGIHVGEDVKKYALLRGFEIYEKMRRDDVPLNEAVLTAVARMAMSIGNGHMAFDMVKQMKHLGINPKLRSYGPALAAFCNSGDIDKAFSVEKHMLEHGVHPEEPELEALLRASVDAGKGDKVYYILHKLRANLGKVSPSAADIIVRWFKSRAASRVGKRKWDQRLLKETTGNRGGGYHGEGWLGKGKWSVSHTSVGKDAFCKCCGEKLAAVDLNPIETQSFAESVASIAIKRDRDSSFKKFQQWLDYYGPFEAVVDGANVGLFNQRRFVPSKISAVVNGIRQKLPSKTWPLIILHNKRLVGPKMDDPVNKALIEKWRNADALYATPTGSNDDWYWLYAAIKFKCLIVTNDEMRDHTFQLLGNDFFPKWKELHQVHFSITDAGPVFHMPRPYSVVIQESEKGSWHIPIVENEHEVGGTCLCITRANSGVTRQDGASSKLEGNRQGRSTMQSAFKIKAEDLKHGNHKGTQNSPQEDYKNLINILTASGFQDHRTVLLEIEAAEKLGDCVIDFQI